MGPLDAIWHLLNFFGPAIGVGLIGSGLAKLLWRRSLRGQAWWQLAKPCIAAGAAALLLGLALFGRDGDMSTYTLLVASMAGAIWWYGFRRGPARSG